MSAVPGLTAVHATAGRPAGDSASCTQQQRADSIAAVF